MRIWTALVEMVCLVAARASAGADVVWPAQAWETSTPEEQGVDSGGQPSWSGRGPQSDIHIPRRSHKDSRGPQKCGGSTSNGCVVSAQG
jgi:hypothetical protein